MCFAQIGDESTENPDEYRDCVVYTLEEADEATVEAGNIMTFTFSDKVSRLQGNNADCGNVEIEEETDEGSLPTCEAGFHLYCVDAVNYPQACICEPNDN